MSLFSFCELPIGPHWMISKPAVVFLMTAACLWHEHFSEHIILTASHPINNCTDKMNMKFHRKWMKRNFQSKWLNWSLYPTKFPQLLIYYVCYLQNTKIIIQEWHRTHFLLQELENCEVENDYVYCTEYWKVHWLIPFCTEVMQLNVLVMVKYYKAYFKNIFYCGSLAFEMQKLVSMAMLLSYKVVLDAVAMKY